MHSKCTLDEVFDDSKGSQTLANGEAEISVHGTGLGWGSHTLVFSSSLALAPYSICANEGQACASTQTASQTAPVFFSFGTKHWVSWEQTRVPPGCPFPSTCTYICTMFRFSGLSLRDQGIHSSRSVLFFIRESSLLQVTCACCASQHRATQFPAPVRPLQAGSCLRQVFRKRN